MLAPMPPASSSPVSGPRRIGGYEIVEKIGEGAMGVVFKARQVSLDREVALKVVKPEVAKDATFLERFQREARSSAQLNHPNIVRGIDVGQDEASGLWYFAMEYVDGPSLKDVLARDGTLPEGRALRIVLQVARALECAAKQNIVHRDIKPDNVMLAKGEVVKLADLGLAKRIDSENAALTQTGKTVGTPYYMAPEQIRGEQQKIDQRTDLYALGATLFHLVTGRPPFHGASGAAILALHLKEPAPRAKSLNPKLSEGINALIAKLLEKEPAQRYQSARELAERVEILVDDPGATSRRPGVRGTTGPRTAVHGAITGRVPLKGQTTGPRAAVSKRVDGAGAAPRPSAQPISTVLVAGVVFALVVLAIGFWPGNAKKPEIPAKPPSVDAPKPIPQAAPVAVVHAPEPAPEPKAVPPTEPLAPAPVAEAPPPAVASEPQAPPPPIPVAPAVPEPVPAAPAPVPAVDEATARAAYAKFQDAFFDALKQGDRAAAERELQRAERDAVLKALKADLALDRRALAWPDAHREAVAAGALKLTEAESIELKLRKGAPIRAGKKENFKVLSVKDGAIQVGGKGLSMPVPLDRLHAETQQALAEPELKATGAGQVILAFVALLQAESADAPEAIRNRLAQAEQAGAAANDAAYVRAALARREGALREQAAAAAWPALLEVAKGAEWPKDQRERVRTALDEFEARHGTTAFAAAHAAERAALRKQAIGRGADVPREGLMAWLRADEGVVAEADGVTQWTDQSGRGWHGVQPEARGRPQFVPKALGELPALRFDGVDDCLMIPQVRGPMKSFTLLWTLRPLSRKNWNQSLSAGGSWGQFVFHTTSEGGVYVGTSVSARISPGEGPGPDTVQLETWQQFAYVFADGEARFFKNGKELAKKRLDVAAWDGFRLGGYDGGNTLHGDVSEVLLYERALPDAERQAVEKHLLPAP
ncbi:MAG: hypothetical protein AMXMBFR7_19380 [Planctomycetota bacterium]